MSRASPNCWRRTWPRSTFWSTDGWPAAKYKDTIIKGWVGAYFLAGDPDLLKLALTAGVGAKNSQGFGCCVLEGEKV